MSETEPLRSTTVATLAAAGFAVPQWDAAGTCRLCGCKSGPHKLVASFGNPLDGGLYYCQNWPECPCQGTWSVVRPPPENGSQVDAV